MLIKNKEFYNVKKRNEKNELVIYENYEKDIIKAISVFLNSTVRLVFLDEKKGVLYFETKGFLWELSDNGGELNIGLVNSKNLISIPYTNDSESLALNPATMGYRLSILIENYNNFKINMIDWNRKFGDCQSNILLRLNKNNYIEA